MIRLAFGAKWGEPRHGADALRHFSEKLTPSEVQEVVFYG